MLTLKQIEPVSMEARTASLKSICTLVADCPHSTPTWTDAGVLVLRSHNIRNGKLNLSSVSFTDEEHYQARIKRAKPQEHDIVITREAPMGEVCMVPAGLKCCLGQRMVLLRPDPSKVIPRFLLYALQSPTVQAAIKSHDGTGSTVSNLRIPLLEGLELNLLPLPEQKEASAFLGAIDDRIENLRQTNETLEAMARTIFKSWFVDFDPVRAKAEGREPEGMDAATAALFPSEFQDSELGPIPQGWSVGKFIALVEIVKDSVNPLKHPEEVFELFSLPGFDEGRKASLLTGSEIKSSKTIVPDGAVLLSKLNPAIERVWAPYLSGAYRSVCSTEFLVLKGHAQASTAFVYCLTRSPGFREILLSLTTGTSNSHQRVRVPDLQAALVVIPEDSVHRAFAEIATPLLQRRNDNLSLIETLTSLRDTLLPRLISGKLRVPEAEAMLAEAL